MTPESVTDADALGMAKTDAERQRDYRRRKAEEREAARRAEHKRELAAVAARFEAGFRECEAERDAAMAEVERCRAELAKFSHPCSAHRQAAEFIARCPRCGDQAVSPP